LIQSYCKTLVPQIQARFFALLCAPLLRTKSKAKNEQAVRQSTLRSIQISDSHVETWLSPQRLFYAQYCCLIYKKGINEKNQ
jgi:hypothetical protein